MNIENDGSPLMSNMCNSLDKNGIRGVSPPNLRKFREFYLAYREIQQTLSVESDATFAMKPGPILVTVSRRLNRGTTIRNFRIVQFAPFLRQLPKSRP
jgi:hypothetical protein